MKKRSMLQPDRRKERFPILRALKKIMKKIKQNREKVNA